jgi:ABC-type microcin C transport system duplicated ATPase subunit YejF
MNIVSKNMTATIIGILGRSRVGKDTVASMLVKHLGPDACVILRLSQPLKDAVKALYGFSDEQVETDIKEAMDPRYNMSPRTAIQHICEHMMKVHGRDFFSKRLYEHEMMYHTGKTVIIPDVRYPHDLDLIRQRGGIILKVTRPFGPQPRHPWEEPIEELQGDYIIENKYDLYHIEKEVKRVITMIIHS